MKPTDIGGEVFEFCLGEFVAASCAEESGKSFPKDDVVGNVGGDFVALKRGLIHKGEFFCAGKTEKGGKAFECFDVAWGRVDAALDFAPVARIQTGAFAEIAKGKALFQAKSFNGITKHVVLFCLW